MAPAIWLRNTWQQSRLPGAVALLLLLFVAVVQLDNALGRIEAPGHPSATLASQFRFDALSGDARDDRRTAWCVWTRTIADEDDSAAARGTTSDAGPNDRVSKCVKSFTGASAHKHITAGQDGSAARLLMRTYVVLDLCLAALYVFLFVLAMRYLANLIPAPGAGGNATTRAVVQRATAPPWLWVLVALLAGSELVEGLCQFGLSLGSLTPYRIDILGGVAGVAAIVKWVSVFLALLLLAMLAVHSRAYAGWTWWKGWAPVRLQLAVAAVLLLLLTGVGTDQVQDALLGLLDHCGRAAGTPLAVLVFSLLLWRSVHRAALTYDDGRPPARQVTVLILSLVCFGVGWLGWHRMWAPAVLGGLILFLSLLGGAKLWTQSVGEPGLNDARAATNARAKITDIEARDQLRRKARILAALPFVVLGVFAVRASVATAVVGPRRPAAIALVFLGAASLMFGVVLPGILAWLEGKWDWAKPPARDKGRSQLYGVLAGVCLVFALVCVFLLTGSRNGGFRSGWAPWPY